MAVWLTFLEKMMNGIFASVHRKQPRPNEIEAVRLIAHRGAHQNTSGIYENTNEAFSLAQKAGCWGIEFDVQVTADDVFIVNHDPTLKRLWGHTVSIAELSFAELRTLEPRIPSLAEVIRDYQDMHLFIELKMPVLKEEILVDTLKSLLPIEQYHLIALDDKILNALTRFPKEALLLVAVHNNVKKFCDLSITKKYGGVLGNYLLFTNKIRKKLHQANQVSGVGFIDSKNSLYRELQKGALWIFTNKAVKMGKVLKQLHNKVPKAFDK